MACSYVPHFCQHHFKGRSQCNVERIFEEPWNFSLLLLLYHWNFLRLIGIFQSNTSNTGCYFKCWMVEISLKSNKILCVWWKKIDKKKAERSRSFKHKDFWFESNSTKVFGVPQLLAKLILLFINAFYLSTFFVWKMHTMVDVV